MSRIAFGVMFVLAVAAQAQPGARAAQLGGPSPGQATPRGQEEVRPFASGGAIRMDLSAGAYRIEGTPDERIVVRWRTRKPEDMARVRVEVNVAGSDAAVRTRGPRNGFEVDVQVPSRSDLNLDLSAGDLTVREIVGDKNVEVWAGDVSIEVGDPGAYRRVDAAVRFGDLTARPFNVVKGGIWRSFRWNGNGKYQLRARLFAGDLKLLR